MREMQAEGRLSSPPGRSSRAASSAPRPATRARFTFPTRRPFISPWMAVLKGRQRAWARCCGPGGSTGDGGGSLRPPSASVAKRRPPVRRHGGCQPPLISSCLTEDREGGCTSAVTASWSFGSAPSREGCASTWRSASPSVLLRGLPAPGGRALGPSSPGSTIAPRTLSLDARVAGPSLGAAPFPVTVPACVARASRGSRMASPRPRLNLSSPLASLGSAVAACGTAASGPLAQGRSLPPGGGGRVTWRITFSAPTRRTGTYVLMVAVADASPLQWTADAPEPQPPRLSGVSSTGDGRTGAIWLQGARRGYAAPGSGLGNDRRDRLGEGTGPPRDQGSAAAPAADALCCGYRVLHAQDRARAPYA